MISKPVETSERRGGAHMDFSERTDTVLNYAELNSKPEEKYFLYLHK